MRIHIYALHTTDCNFVVRRLLWNNSGDIRKAINSNCGRPFDIVIASDIVALPYLDYIPDLLDAVSKLLANDGVFYLAYQRRHRSEESFFEQLRARSFYLREVSRDKIHKDFRENLAISILMIGKISHS